MIAARITCNQCLSDRTSFDGTKVERGIAPSGNSYVSISYRCNDCNVVSFLNIVQTEEGIQIA